MNDDHIAHPGGAKPTMYVSAQELGLPNFFPTIDMLSTESIEKMKGFADRTPDQWLKYQLDLCVKRELYEVAAYIQAVAAKRGVDVS